MNKGRFEHLLEPTEIGRVKLHNRIIMPAMGTNFATEDEYVTDKLKLHLASVPPSRAHRFKKSQERK